VIYIYIKAMVPEQPQRVEVRKGSTTVLKKEKKSEYMPKQPLSMYHVSTVRPYLATLLSCQFCRSRRRLCSHVGAMRNDYSSPHIKLLKI